MRMPLIKNSLLPHIVFLLIGLLGARTSHAEVDNIEDFFEQTVIQGHLRTYFFTRDYLNPTPYRIDQQAVSAGGYLGILTPSVYGFQSGLTLYGANSLGLNPVNPDQVDTTLPGNTLYALGEAFLRYKDGIITLQGPEQVIDTPWVGPADGRMLQSTFRGFYGTLTPLEHVTLAGFRLTDFKGRDEGVFTPSNLYYPGYAGGSPVQGLQNHATSGAQGVSLQYGMDKKDNPIRAQFWWNHFFNFSNLLWLDGRYTCKTGDGLNPFIGFQFANQSGDGENYLQLYGNQGKAGNVQAYGVIAGWDMLPWLSLQAAYNAVGAQTGAFANGDLLSPYSTGYATDPLYTTSMIGGMIEKQAPGQAYKVSATAWLYDRQLKALASFAEYYVSPYTRNQSEFDLDITYTFPKGHTLNGLSIRDRLGLLSGNPDYSQFYYNRVMIEYVF
ncbi:OprD family porin [Candidatus Methylospira mobilis]|uniref:OprD family porin n=2 Tax=Candidatus Methylospira mobilis TaxID=1808979 RepID=A0A5Q0BL12_9GAMM|nr:hypothetical protein [Candidatus Methylospira mobilis]QFY44279.1 OprD family porin [Candidatus Methylospira mobilis]